MLPPDCRCYLLNLDRSPERLASMHTQLEARGIDYERVSGVDGLALDEASFREHTRENRYYKPIRRGEVGCQLGHLKALQTFLDSPARYALILEDDAALDAQLCPAIVQALALRDTAHDPLLHWDVLKLTQRRRHSRYIELAPLGTRHLVEYGLSVPSTTTAAVWTREAAARWVSSYRGTRRPIDCDLQHPWEYPLTILSIHPPLAATEDSLTTMDSPNRTTRHPWSKLRYELARIWPRLRHFSRRYGWSLLLRWLWQKHPLLPHQDTLMTTPDASTPPRKIRVLHFVTGSLRGGSAQVAIQLVNAALSSEHVEPLLVLRCKRKADPKRMVQELEATGTPVRTVPRDWFRIATIYSLIRICREFRPDILMAHGFTEHLWGRYAGLLAGVPHLIQVEHNTRERYTPLRRAQTRWLAKRSARIIGVSEGVRQVMLDMGLPIDRTIAIPNGIDLAPFANADAHPLISRVAGIVMAARLCRQKDHATLLRAIALLRERGLTPPVLLAGAGRPYHLAPLKRLNTELGLQDQVQFLGLHHNVPGLLLGHRICVLSTHYEGMPLALIEGMAAGCAVVASDVPGVGGIIVDGLDGLMVPGSDPNALADALERLLRDDALATSLGAAARSKALTDYGRETMNARYERLCLELAAMPPFSTV